jgi:hypothetical protein
VWRADEVSQGVSFPAKKWTGELKIDSSWSYTVDIGNTNEERTEFYSNGQTGSEISYSGESSTWNIVANAFTVPASKYLAFKVTNNGAKSMTITTDGSSFVTWPADTPPYPVPELPSIALLATGLLCLAGYVGLIRRKDST